MAMVTIVDEGWLGAGEGREQVAVLDETVLFVSNP
jgi:hypothetical protein